MNYFNTLKLMIDDFAASLMELGIPEAEAIEMANIEYFKQICTIVSLN